MALCCAHEMTRLHASANYGARWEVSRNWGAGRRLAKVQMH